MPPLLIPTEPRCRQAWLASLHDLIDLRVFYKLGGLQDFLALLSDYPQLVSVRDAADKLPVERMVAQLVRHASQHNWPPNLVLATQAVIDATDPLMLLAIIDARVSMWNWKDLELLEPLTELCPATIVEAYRTGPSGYNLLDVAARFGRRVLATTVVRRCPELASAMTQRNVNQGFINVQAERVSWRHICILKGVFDVVPPAQKEFQRAVTSGNLSLAWGWLAATVASRGLALAVAMVDMVIRAVLPLPTTTDAMLVGLLQWASQPTVEGVACRRPDLVAIVAEFNEVRVCGLYAQSSNRHSSVQRAFWAYVTVMLSSMPMPSPPPAVDDACTSCCP
jgi:hypothetical protein